MRVFFYEFFHMSAVFTSVCTPTAETTSKEIMRALVLPGKDLPAPLGGLTIFDISNKTTNPERVFLPSISALMLCCCTMLKTSYPVQVASTFL